jgi:DUF1365 family protein
MFLDLKELPTLFDMHPLWSYQRFNVAYFRRKDHFGDPSVPMDTAVRDLVQMHLGNRPTGPIRMLTHLRYFGYCFNPASFYYCYDASDNRVETIVVEIHNTPWLERHCYVLGDTHNEHPVDHWRRYRFNKQFHVSPFIDMDIHYDWRFRVPGENIRVHMIDVEKGKKLFDASLILNRQPMTYRALTRMLLKYPLMTMKVTTMIYFQALRLMLKHTPVFTHPKKRSLPHRGYEP